MEQGFFFLSGGKSLKLVSQDAPLGGSGVANHFTVEEYFRGKVLMCFALLCSTCLIQATVPGRMLRSTNLWPDLFLLFYFVSLISTIFFSCWFIVLLSPRLLESGQHVILCGIMPMFMGLKQKEVLVCCLHLKCRVNPTAYFCLVKLKLSTWCLHLSGRCQSPVCSVSKKNNALIFAR